jgi:hypoxanthine phosphoribosyltransferase
VADDRLDVIVSEAAIRARVAELAERISADYAGADELLLVGVLRGAFIFVADLARALRVSCRVDFLAVSRYEQGAEPGAVRLVMDLRTDVRGRHVLLVEDIVDSGHTLAYILGLLRARGPASLRACALTRKPRRLEVDVPLDYVGFDLPDRWVVGYGLDYSDRYRTLPYIAALPAPATAR